MTHHIDPRDTARNNIIAAGLALQQCTKTAANIVDIPGKGQIVAIGTKPDVARLLELVPAATKQVSTAQPGDYLPKRDVADEIVLLSNVIRHHPQLKPLLGREALMMRCVREALAVQASTAQADPEYSAELVQLRAQNMLLVGLYDAVAKLVKAKGRFHTEQNYGALVAAFDLVRTADTPTAKGAAGREGA